MASILKVNGRIYKFVRDGKYCDEDETCALLQDTGKCASSFTKKLCPEQFGRGYFRRSTDIKSKYFNKEK